MIQIGLHDRFIYNLLQLLILQIAPHHHLQHDEQLSITDVAVTVDIVDFEGKAQLLLLVALGAEGAEAGYKLLEIDVPAAVLVEDGNHAGGERVAGDLGEGEELVTLDGAGVVLVVVAFSMRRRQDMRWVFGVPYPTS